MFPDAEVGVLMAEPCLNLKSLFYAVSLTGWNCIKKAKGIVRPWREHQSFSRTWHAQEACNNLDVLSCRLKEYGRCAL